MRKNSVLGALAGLAVAALVCSGCQSFKSSVPRGGLALEKLKTTATYDILGDAKGTASGATLFGFIPVGGERKRGSFGRLQSDDDEMGGQEIAKRILFWPYYLFGGGSSIDPVEQSALYNAIESVPTADMLLMPRYNVERSNYIVYSEKTVSVKGKAVRLNTSVK